MSQKDYDFTQWLFVEQGHYLIDLTMIALNLNLAYFLFMQHHSQS